MIEIEDIEAAARRIAPLVRKTPILRAGPMREVPGQTRGQPGGQSGGRAELILKLESLQITGSFKARGAANALAALPPDALSRGVVTASGGNHGLGVAHAASRLGIPAEVFVMGTTTEAKIGRLTAMGARVSVVPGHLPETEAAARARVAETGGRFVHPFAEPLVAAGQGTMALELLDQVPFPDTVIIAIGGGGLITGMSVALKARAPGTRIIGVEPVGAPTMTAALAAGHPVAVPITSRVATLSATRTDPGLFARVAPLIDEVVLVEDEEMLAASQWLWREFAVAADLSGAAACAALMAGRVGVEAGEQVVALVCGAGPDGISA